MSSDCLKVWIPHSSEGYLNHVHRAIWHFRKARKESGLEPEDRRKDTRSSLEPILCDSEDQDVSFRSKVSFCFEYYHLLVALDITPSMCSLAFPSNSLMFELLQENVEKVIAKALAEKEGRQKIFLSVVAFRSNINSWHLLMGIELSSDSIDKIQQTVKQSLRQLISEMIEQRVANGEIIREQSSKCDSSLFSILNYARFCFERHSFRIFGCKPILLILTDGILDPFESGKYETILTLLIKEDVTIYAKVVEGAFGFGKCPNIEALELLCCSSGGLLLPDLDRISIFMLSSPFDVRDYSSSSFASSSKKRRRRENSWTHAKFYDLKVKEYYVKADMECILRARLLEGFSGITMHTFPRSIEKYAYAITMTFEWKYNVIVEYQALVSRSQSDYIKITVLVSSNHEFLRRFQSKGPSSSSSHISDSQTNVNSEFEKPKPAWNLLIEYLQCIIQADQFLSSFYSVLRRCCKIPFEKISNPQDAVSRNDDIVSDVQKLVAVIAPLSLMTWRIWMDVIQLEIFCNVGFESDSIPKSWLNENQPILKELLNAELRDWASFCPSENTFFLFKPSDDDVGLLAIIRSSWISHFQAKLSIGVFDAKSSDLYLIYQEIRSRICGISFTLKDEALRVADSISPFWSPQFSLESIIPHHQDGFINSRSIRFLKSRSKLRPSSSNQSSRGSLQHLSFERSRNKENFASVEKYVEGMRAHGYSNNASIASDDSDAPSADDNKSIASINSNDSDVDSSNSALRTNSFSSTGKSSKFPTSCSSEVADLALGGADSYLPLCPCLRDHMIVAFWTFSWDDSEFFDKDAFMKAVGIRNALDQFRLVQSSDFFESYFRMIRLCSSRSTSLQYVIIQDSNSISAEIWIEPVDDTQTIGCLTDEMLTIIDFLYSRDLSIISSIFTYQAVRKNEFFADKSLRNINSNTLKSSRYCGRTCEVQSDIPLHLSSILGAAFKTEFRLDCPNVIDVEHQHWIWKVFRNVCIDHIKMSSHSTLVHNEWFMIHLLDSIIYLIHIPMEDDLVTDGYEFINLQLFIVHSDQLAQEMSSDCDSQFLSEQLLSSSWRICEFLTREEINRQKILARSEEILIEWLSNNGKAIFSKTVYNAIVNEVNIKVDDIEYALDYCTRFSFDVDISLVCSLSKVVRNGAFDVGKQFRNLISKQYLTHDEAFLFVLKNSLKQSKYNQRNNDKLVSPSLDANRSSSDYSDDAFVSNEVADVNGPFSFESEEEFYLHHPFFLRIQCISNDRSSNDFRSSKATSPFMLTSRTSIREILSFGSTPSFDLLSEENIISKKMVSLRLLCYTVPMVSKFAVKLSEIQDLLDMFPSHSIPDSKMRKSFSTSLLSTSFSNTGPVLSWPRHSKSIRSTGSASDFSQNSNASKKAADLHVFSIPIQRHVKRLAKSLESMLSDDVLHKLLFVRPTTKLSFAHAFETINHMPKKFLSEFTVKLSFLDLEFARLVFENALSENKCFCFEKLQLGNVQVFCLKEIYVLSDDKEDIQSFISCLTEAFGRSYRHMGHNLSDLFSSGPPLWVFLTRASDENVIHVRFHASIFDSSERLFIQNRFTKFLYNVVHRVNQLFLLRNLHQTRIASPLLIPPSLSDAEYQNFSKIEENASTKKSRRKLLSRLRKRGGSMLNALKEKTGELADVSRDESLEKKNILNGSMHTSGVPRDMTSQSLPSHISERAKYSPGEFACPCVHTVYLPVNERLQVQMTIGTLSSSTLNPFAVTNRRFVYVYEDKRGGVFYLKISELQEESESNSQSCILLEFFGIDQPGQEVTVEIPFLVRSKICSLTMTVISNLLSRNPNMKLTKSDHEFIISGNSAPTIAFICLDHGILDYYFLLLIFRQNILKNMYQLNLSAEATAAFDSSANSSLQSTYLQCHKPTVAISSQDTSFLYKYDHRLPFCNVIGKGLATIYCTLCDKFGRSVLSVNTLLTADGLIQLDDEISTDTILRSLLNFSSCGLENSVLGNSERLEGEMFLKIEINSIGSLTAQRIVEHMVTGMKQSIVDFFIELLSSRMEILQYSHDLRSLLLRCFRRLKTWDVPVLKSWLCKEFFLGESPTIDFFKYFLGSLKYINNRVFPIFIVFYDDADQDGECVVINSYDEMVFKVHRSLWNCHFFISGGFSTSCIVKAHDSGSISESTIYSRRSSTISIASDPEDSVTGTTNPSSVTSSGFRSFSHPKKMLYEHITSSYVPKTMVAYRSCGFFLSWNRNGNLELWMHNFHQSLVKNVFDTISKIVDLTLRRQMCLKDMLLVELGIPCTGLSDVNCVDSRKIGFSHSGIFVGDKQPFDSIDLQGKKAQQGLNTKNIYWNSVESQSLSDFVNQRKFVSDSSFSSLRKKHSLACSSQKDSALGLAPLSQNFRFFLGQAIYYGSSTAEFHEESNKGDFSRHLLKSQYCRLRHAYNGVKSLLLKNQFSKKALSLIQNGKNFESNQEDDCVGYEKSIYSLLDSSRILHISRAALLFQQLIDDSEASRDDVANLSAKQEISSHQSIASKYYRILENFLQDYVEYLEQKLQASVVSIVTDREGMNDLDTESGDDFKNVESATLMRVSSFNKLSINELRNHYAGHNRPRIRLNGAVISLKPIFVYLRKQVADSTIILELSFQDAMTCCCFYLVDTTLTSGMFPRKDFLTRKSDEMRHTASAVSESTFLSTSIHLKAFLYDFHLRHLYFYLDNNSSCYPTFDVEKFLNSFDSKYSTPPSNVRNYLQHHYIEHEFPFSVNIYDDSFFQHLCKNSAFYGFSNLKSKSPKFFFKLFNPRELKINMLTEKEEMFVAIFLSDTTIDSMVVSSVKIRCFLLYVDLENRFPISELSVEDSMGKHESQNRKECLSKALVDLIHNEMKTALHSCWKDFRRDNAWNRVMDLESLSPDDIVSFYNQSIKKDLAKVDPRLREILNISNFRDLILSSVTRIYSRQLIEFEHSHGKAIIILSKDEKNLCIVLDKIESSADFSLSIYLRTKEMLTRISESALIPKFVNDIIYLLWKWLYS